MADEASGKESWIDQITPSLKKDGKGRLFRNAGVLASTGLAVLFFGAVGTLGVGGAALFTAKTAFSTAASAASGYGTFAHAMGWAPS